MEKKKSSIDWLVEEINKQKAWADSSKLEPIIQQAKAMHKDEIEDAYDMGYLDYQNLTYDSAQEYFKDIYGGNNE